MTVIGLTGLAGSGKSTVAKYLVDTHGYQLVSFAAPLKKMMRTLDPYIGIESVRWYQVWKRPKAIRLSDLLKTMTEAEIKTSKYGPEYRRLLQTLGTDCIRAVDPDFWVKAAVVQVADPNKQFVFDDVRFPNEADAIRQMNPEGLWHISRPGQPLIGGGHESEKHAGNMQERVYIINDDLDELYLHVDKHLLFYTSEAEPINMRHTDDDLYTKSLKALRHFSHRGNSAV